MPKFCILYVKKRNRLEKSTPPPVVAVVANMRNALLLALSVDESKESIKKVNFLYRMSTFLPWKGLFNIESENRNITITHSSSSKWFIFCRVQTTTNITTPTTLRTTATTTTRKANLMQSFFVLVESIHDRQRQPPGLHFVVPLFKVKWQSHPQYWGIVDRWCSISKLCFIDGVGYNLNHH